MNLALQRFLEFNTLSCKSEGKHDIISSSDTSGVSSRKNLMLLESCSVVILLIIMKENKPFCNKKID